MRKYDAAGNELWTRQFGSPSADDALAIAAGASGIYVAGRTLGTLPGQTSSGMRNAYVRKYDTAGNELWTRQFGVSDWADAFAVAADASVYVAGGGGGPTRVGPFVRKYDADGNELWTRRFGSEMDDTARGIAVNASGIYIAGTTWGTLPGQTSVGVEGLPNAFVARLVEVVEVVAVPLDIRPRGCPNPINAGGVLPAAILGTADFDVLDIAPYSVAITGMMRPQSVEFDEPLAPLRFNYEDVAAPFWPFTGKQAASDCTREGPDGFLDMTLHFDHHAIAAAIGPVSQGDVLVLQITGELYDGTAFVGEDVVVRVSR